MVYHNKDFIELKAGLEKISKKKLCIKEHMQRNDKLLEELESLKYEDVNLETFLEKFVEFKNDESKLVGKINNLREEMKKLGIKVPPKLVL